MNYYSSITVNGRIHVLTIPRDRFGQYKTANFRGTGHALCGVTRKGESLNEWIERRG